MAAVLWAGRSAALGDRSGAALWQILPPWRGDVEVVGTRMKSARGVRVRRSRSLPRSDVTRHFGIPVTTPARTLIDLATVVDVRTLEAALAEAEVRGLVRPDRLAERATGALAEVLGVAAPTRSELERAFRRFVREYGLPMPVINGFVEGFEVDAHWPEARLIVELDSWRYHGTRRAFEVDRERDAIVQAAGWRVVRLTDRGLGAKAAARLNRMLGRAPPRAAAPRQLNRSAAARRDGGSRPRHERRGRRHPRRGRSSSARPRSSSPRCRPAATTSRNG
jgi:Protein of unknown function (DUF559)